MRSTIRRGLGIAVVGLIGICVLQGTALAQIGRRAWHVSATRGNDVTGRGTVLNPLLTIQAAIDRAADGDTIKVASGTYFNISISGRTGLVLLGGYGPAFMRRDVYEQDPAVLTDNGMGWRSVVEIAGCADIVLDGFVILSGNVGVYSLDSRRIRIMHSMVVGSSEYGFLVDGGKDVGILNNFLWANFGYGIGVHAYDGAGILIGNNTILGNLSSGIVLVEGDHIAKISSNIIAVNLGYGIEQWIAEAKAVITYNDIWGNNAGAFYRWGEFNVDDINYMPSNTGNIEADPLFVNLDFEDPGNMDFHLQPGSPAIDAGDPALPFNREPMPNGGRVNMGAFGNTPEATTSPGGPAYALSERGHDFGDVDVGRSSEPWTVSMKNVGTEAVEIYNIELQGPGKNAFKPSGPNGARLVFPIVIPPSQSRGMEIVFAPSAAGPVEVTVVFQTNAGPGELVLSGNGIPAVEEAPNLVLSERGHKFGEVPIYEQSEPWPLTLYNRGNADLDIHNVGVGPPVHIEDFSPLDQMGWTIPPGGSVTLSVVFVPETPGEIHMIGGVETNDPDEPFVEIILSGIGIELLPDLVLSGRSHDFGAVEVGQRSSAWELVISNEGEADLDFENFVLDPEEVFEKDLSEIDAMNWFLPPEGQVTVRVYFEPTAEGEQTSILKVWTNDPDEPLVQVELTGTGTAQLVEDRPRIAFSAEWHDFGDVPVGGQVTWDLTISNEGTADLLLTELRIEPDPEEGIFTFDASEIEAASWMLTPGARVKLPCFFEPKFEGPIERTLRVFSRDPVRSEVAITLLGKGVVVPVPVIALSEESHDFGEIQVGESSSTWDLVISNSGTADLIIAEESGVSGDDFWFANIEGSLTVPPNGQLILSIVFQPTSEGEQTGSVGILSNDPNRPTVTVPLSGTGIQAPVPVIALSEESHDFGEVVVGDTSAVWELFISNSGTADLIIDLDNSKVVGPFKAIYHGDLTISPDASLRFTVLFIPPSAGGQTGEIELVTNDPNRPTVRTSLSGTGIQQDIEVSESAHDFGSIELGSSKEWAFTIQNAGTANLQLQSVSLPEGSVFSLAEPIGAQTIRPGGAVEVKIRFAPSGLGSAEDRLTVRSDDPDEEALQVRLTGTGADTTPPTIAFNPSSISEPPANTAVRVQATLSDAGDIAEARLLYRAGGKPDFQSVAMTSADGGTFSAEIPAALVTVRGIVYSLQATDAAGNVQREPEEGAYGLRVSVPKMDRPVTRAAAYQMVSLPLEAQNASPQSILESVLGTYDNTQWRLFTYQPSGYVEYPAGNIRFQPGRAFWLITKESVQLSSGPGLGVSPDEPFRLTLQPGWNMVGNPFSFSIDWTQIPHEGKRIEAPWDYDGTSFQRGNLLRPWYGYAVKNLESSAVQLLIEPREAGTARSVVSPLTKAGASGGWVVRLEAQADRFRDVENYLGVLADASEEWDPNEWSEPPPIGDFVSIQFDHTDWGVYPGLYTTDFRPLGSDHLVWDFEVETNLPSSPVRLTWAVGGADQGPMELRLVDLSRQTAVDLAETDAYTFFSGSTGAHRRFRLFIGDQAFVNEQTAVLADRPRDFVLRQNIPNPFNRTTTISFEVPARGASDRVTLRILDLLGRTVRTLFHDRVEAGTYTLLWDGLDDQGRPVSSGVYLMRMEGRSFSDTKKMSLLR